MNVAALVVLLGLVGTAFSKPNCPENCTSASTSHMQMFKLITDLQHSSVAPWKLTSDYDGSRHPRVIQHAVCINCTVEDMVAKPISIKISVFHSAGSDSSWCRCPYELAVGCTCVRKAATATQ